MSRKIKLAAEKRDGVGKGSSRADRRSGFVPAVVYGNKKEPVSIKIKTNALIKEVFKEGFFSHIIDLKVGNDEHMVIAKDIQLHPVSDQPLHVDFLRVSETSEIQVDVPLHFVDDAKSPGLKKGGVLNAVTHTLQVKCPANAIPESFTVSLDGLEIGDTVHASDLDLGDKVTVASQQEVTIAVIATPKGGLGDTAEDEAGDEEAGEEAAEE